MKRLLSLCFALVLSASLLSLKGFALDVPVLISDAAVLMDAETGQVLYQKNRDKRMYPASTTKIMTGLLAAENCSPAETALVSGTAIDIDEWDSANIALLRGEEMSVDSLMYAMMLHSANDAANVLAEHISGDQSEFADLMNKRAESIGASSTHFANPHGLHDPDHYTTAYDIALITREAIRNKTFLKYFGTDSRSIAATNKNPYERSFTNYQYMLVSTTDYYYPGVFGGKVGYTHEAEHTMSTVAEKDGRVLICVVMKSPNRGDKFEDTKKLLDFGFGEFYRIDISRQKFSGFEEKIMQGETQTGAVRFRSAYDFEALLHTSLEPSAINISYSGLPPQSADSAQVFAEFIADTGNEAIPALLGRMKLERSVIMYSAGSPDTALSSLASALNESPWVLPLALFLMVSAIFLLFAFTGKLSAYSREKRRRKRLEALKSAKEARYRDSIPAIGNRLSDK